MITLLWGFFRVLHNGIEIPKLRVASIEMRGFYLSLDKKLILRLDSLNLTPLLDSPASQESSDLSEILGWIKNTKLLLGYFQEIRLKEVILGENQGSLLFEGERYELSLPDLYASITLDEQKGHVLAQIQEILYKPYKARFMGKADYGVLKNHLTLEGVLSIDSAIHLNVRGESDFKRLHLEGESLPFDSLRFLKDVVEIENPNIRAWLYDNIHSLGMELASFSFDSELNEKAILESIEKRLKARLEIASPEVTFHPDLPPLHGRGVSVIYDERGVSFELYEPSFEGFSLEGSQVGLRDIWGEKPWLDLLIKTEAVLDERIHKVLKAYKIKLPLHQKDSTTLAKLKLEVDLNDYETEVIGYFETKKSNFSLNRLDFYAQEASVKLVNSLIEILPSRIKIGNFLDSELAFSIDTRQELIEGKAHILDFSIGDRGEILRIKGIEIPFSADYKSAEIPLRLPTLETRLVFGERLHRIQAQNLALFYPYSKLLREESIRAGWINLETKDFERFSLQASLQGLSYPLAERDGTPVESLEIEGQTSPSSTQISSLDGRLRLEILDKTKLFLRDYDIPLIEESNPKESESKKSETEITGENLHLIYKGKRILSDRFKATLKGKENISATLSYKNGTLKANLQNKRLKIEARHFNDEFVNTFFNKEIASGGRFDLIGEYGGGVFKGKSFLWDTTLKNLNTLQNVIALIDSIPSLLIFKAPGFSAEGYAIKQGEAEIGINDRYAVVERFLLHGTSIDSEGSGVVELESSQIEFQTRFKTIKSLGTIVSNIPLLGYIIMGEDGSLSTEVTLTGTLDKPIAQTNLAQDTLKAPLNILERLIKTPLRLFGE